MKRTVHVQEQSQEELQTEVALLKKEIGELQHQLVTGVEKNATSCPDCIHLRQQVQQMQDTLQRIVAQSAKRDLEFSVF